MEGSWCPMMPILGWLQTQSWRLESKTTVVTLALRFQRVTMIDIFCILEFLHQLGNNHSLNSGQNLPFPFSPFCIGIDFQMC